jgi:hypothetical protein
MLVDIAFFPLSHFTNFPLLPIIIRGGKVMQTTKLKLDGKKRLSVGKLIGDEVTGFNVTKCEDGSFIFEPTIDVPVSEVWLFRNEKALAAVKKGLHEAASGKTKKLDSSLLAEDDDE